MKQSDQKYHNALMNTLMKINETTPDADISLIRLSYLWWDKIRFEDSRATFQVIDYENKTISGIPIDISKIDTGCAVEVTHRLHVDELFVTD